MGTETGAFHVVQDAITSYAEGVESWKSAYVAAMKCRDLEDWLYVGNGIFDAITAFDEKHQFRVLSGEIEYDPAHNELIKSAYKWWLGPCEVLSTEINSLRAQGFLVDNSEAFLSNCRESTGILTDDAEFFDSEALIALRDEAIDEHRAGESLEFGQRQ